MNTDFKTGLIIGGAVLAANMVTMGISAIVGKIKLANMSKKLKEETEKTEQNKK